MTEMVLDVLYYGFLLMIFLATSLPTIAVYFLLKYVWKRSWVEKVAKSVIRLVAWVWNLFRRFVKWLGALLQRGVSKWWSRRKKRIKWLGKVLIRAGILVGGTIVFARFFPNPGLDELKLYLAFLVAAAFLVLFNRWLVAN